MEFNVTAVWSLLGFILSLGILVTLHEWGHFIVARLFNIKVEVFSIGFGRPLWRREWRNTCYQVASIPLGGFVKFVDERNGPVEEKDLPYAFNRQPAFKRFLVVLAGPAINLIFAWLAFTMVYAIGTQELKPLVEINDGHAVVFQEDHPWEIVEVNHQPVRGWSDLQRLWLVDQLSAELGGVQLALQAFDPDGREIDYQTLMLPLPQSFHKPDDFKKWLEDNGLKPYRPDFPPVVEKVLPSSPAQQMGLKPEDRIVEINGQPIEGWKALVHWVKAHPNEAVTITVLRQGQTVSLKGRLGFKSVSKEKEAGFLGATVQVTPEMMKPYLTTVSYPLPTAMLMGAEKLWSLTKMTYYMVVSMLAGQASSDALSGPIGIAQMSGQALQSGTVVFLSFLGVLSLSLGLLNLLPIPVLDGGHLLFYLYEMVARRPVNEAFQMQAQIIGMVLILILTAFAIANDINRLANGG